MATGEIPESVYRNTLDLDRFSTGVAKKLIRSYDRIIKDAIVELARIEQMKKADQPKYKADRLRSLLKQLQASLRNWSDKSADQMVRDLDGIARLQSEFAQLQLEKALPTGVESVVKPLNITRGYADSVVNSKPIDLNASLLSDDLQSKVKGIPEKFSLTAKKGALVNLPNGEPLLKNFRALAQKQATMFGQTVRDGMLIGETTPQIARRLRSQLLFEDGKLMKNNQVSTLVRTSVHQVSNDAAQSVYEANQDITSKYKWIATLDSRTAPQCRVLDQQVFDYGQGPQPPQHFNCRCRTVAEIDYERLGVRPPSKPLGERSAVGGSVPAGTTYGKYLSKQSASYKAKALGKTKVKYFNFLSKKYGPDEALKKMIRNDGQSKTLAQLRKAYGKTPNAKPKPRPKKKITPKRKPVSPAVKAAKTQAKLKDTQAQLKALKGRDPTLPTVAQLQSLPKNSKIKAVDVNKAFDLMDEMPGIAGENARKLRKFIEERQVFVSWSSREAKRNLVKSKDSMAFLLQNPQLKKSLAVGLERLERIKTATGKEMFSKLQAKNIISRMMKSLETGIPNYTTRSYLTMYGQGQEVGGFTFPFANHIVVRRTSSFKKITSLKDIRSTVSSVIKQAVQVQNGELPASKLSWLARGNSALQHNETGSWLATIVHEMGHQVDYAAGKIRRDFLYRPSGYGSTNDMEQFAETFVQYIFDPVGLKKASPLAYKWVDDSMTRALIAPR